MKATIKKNISTALLGLSTIVTPLLWGGVGAGLFLTSCSDDDPGIAAVTNVTYEPTMGGAIIRFTPPASNDLLYVKASYVNSLGESAFRSTSIYNTEIEIDGLADETRDYPVRISAVNKWGGESDITTISVRPNRSYINIIADNLKVSPICGGLCFTWENPAGADSTSTTKNPGKAVYVVVDYVDSANVSRTRYLGNNKKVAVSNVRGMVQGKYQVSYHVEDFSGNKTVQSEQRTITVPPEVLFPKYYMRNNGLEGEEKEFIWKLDSKLTTLTPAHEYTNEAIFDGIINDKNDPETASYCGTAPSGNIEFDSDAVDIVVDMNQIVSISRIKAWQRAYHYGTQPYAKDENGNAYSRPLDDNKRMSEDYDYYQPENLKHFRLYGSKDKENWFVIQDCDIATNSTAGALPRYWTNPNWYGHEVANMPDNESYQAAIDGHEWLLDQMTDSVRYVRVRMVESWDMAKRTLSGMSELNLYGTVLVDYKTLAEEEGRTLPARRKN